MVLSNGSLILTKSLSNQPTNRTKKCIYQTFLYIEGNIFSVNVGYSGICNNDWKLGQNMCDLQ